jgi:diguanylate cyclase (GGDEF)-like protein
MGKNRKEVTSMGVDSPQDKIFELEKINQILHQKVLELYTLHNISKSLGSTLSLDEVYTRTVELVQHSLQVDMYSLMLLDEKRDTLTTKVSSGLDVCMINECQVDEGFFGHIALSKRPKLIKDVSQDNIFKEATNFSIKEGSYLGLPLIGQGSKVIGVLNVYKQNVEAFSESDLGFYATIAEHVAIAIENARLYQRTQDLSHRDDLTSLFNRRYFFDIAHKEIKRAQRYGRKVSMIMLDIDHFKRFNDRYGHLEGDRALKQVAGILNSLARHADVVARYGGDEFLMLLPETDKIGGKILAERIRKRLSCYTFKIGDISEGNGNLTVTIGLGTYPQDALYCDELTEYADMSLYAGKARGRNCVSLSPITDMSTQKDKIH